MKYLITFLLFCIVLTTANSQTITPIQTSEFCPNTEYTFNVTIDEETDEVKKSDKDSKVIFLLYNLNRTTVVKQWTVDNTSKNHQLNIEGLKEGNYILVAKKGKYQRATQIFINR